MPFKCCTSLEQLDLDGDDDIGSDGAVSLAGLLKCYTCLKALNSTIESWRHSIGSDGAVALVYALNFSTILKVLNLGGNNIG